jgi:hypothetical protein
MNIVKTGKEIQGLSSIAGQSSYKSTVLYTQVKYL